MRRAAIWIPSNIAEGEGRNNSKEFIHFLRISQGSIAELETQILIGLDLGHFKNTTIQGLLDELDEISKMVIGLQKSLQKNDIPYT